MIELSTIRDLVAIFGVIAGFTYYVLTVRANQKNQELALETRQTALFMQVYNRFMDKEFQRDYRNTIYKYEWKDLDEFRDKYVQDDNTREAILGLENYFEGLGVLVYRKQIDINLIDDLLRSYVINYWEKVRPAFIEFRDVNPFTGEWTEYLYNELQKTEGKPAYKR